MLVQRLAQFMIRRLAKVHGFLDPLNLISKLNRFAQPAEVAAPTELMRAGAIFHARGLINCQVIQHNLDWVWPYWVEKQFNPRDLSFVPRAFSATHINLTHRNWTAVGLPYREETPIVDPRGLVTPFWDSWSVDFWIVNQYKPDLIPSRCDEVNQFMDLQESHKVITQCGRADMSLQSEVEFVDKDGAPHCRINLVAQADPESKVVVSIRPSNPEGVSFVNDISLLEDKKSLSVNKTHCVRFDQEPQYVVFSNYKNGDVYRQIFEQTDVEKIKCPAGMCTAGAVFEIGDKTKNIEVDIPLYENDKPDRKKETQQSTSDWSHVLDGSCRLNISEKKFQMLYDSALHTSLIHTAEEVYAGPYTYKRFWFRDAVYITYTLLCCGFFDRAERIIDGFEDRQTFSGYFQSQEGEWDSNGQVLWVIDQFCRKTNRKPKKEWRDSILKGARWILRKRLSTDLKKPHAGLLPAGFSAEHFGPNDHYYWDDFWGVSGLRAAQSLLKGYEGYTFKDDFTSEAESLMESIEKALKHDRERLDTAVMASSPYRRLDSASVGTLVCGYPLQLWPKDDERLVQTADYLKTKYAQDSGFFHDMSHSGINPYLTLHIAQVFLRAGDKRYIDLMQSIADLASSTGQWPEAVHPFTKGGCMGDGQHVWAACEWIVMMRNCFLREEGDALVLCGGLRSEWLSAGGTIHFGPAPTDFGRVSLEIESHGKRFEVSWQGSWHAEVPQIAFHFAGMKARMIDHSDNKAVFEMEDAL